MLLDEVELLMDVEYFDGRAFDTEVILAGSFCVSCNRRKEFSEKLQQLVEEYHI